MTLEKFNSTLGINQKISTKIADFELVNSELRENGAAIRLNYREIKSKKTKKWQINELMHISIDYYKNQLKNTPDCKLKKDDIHNKIILNEFNNCFFNIIESIKERDGRNILDSVDLEMIDLGIPMISKSIIFDLNDQCQLTQLHLTSLKNNFLKFHTNVHLFSKSTENDKEIFQNIWLSMAYDLKRDARKKSNSFLNEFIRISLNIEN
mgnify:FL=1